MKNRETNTPYHFRVNDEIRQGIRNFARPRGLPEQTALRVLIRAGLQRTEREQIDLSDPMKKYAAA
jgi:hypothetical protein